MANRGVEPAQNAVGIQEGIGSPEAQAVAQGYVSIVVCLRRVAVCRGGGAVHGQVRTAQGEVATYALARRGDDDGAIAEFLVPS